MSSMGLTCTFCRWECTITGWLGCVDRERQGGREFEQNKLRFLLKPDVCGVYNAQPRLISYGLAFQDLTKWHCLASVYKTCASTAAARLTDPDTNSAIGTNAVPPNYGRHRRTELLLCIGCPICLMFHRNVPFSSKAAVALSWVSI